MACNPKAANASTQSLNAAHASSIAYVQCQNLKYNAIIIGWLGVIISSVMIFSSMMVINMQADIELLLKQLLHQQLSERELLVLMNLLAAFSTVAYGMSLINLGVCLLLLIGVARESSGLLYPWLIFHGVTFGVSLYMGIFHAMAGLFIDLSSFLMCLLVFTLVLVLYYKIYHEVFTLFRVMQEQNMCNAMHCPDAEHAYVSGVQYSPLYLSQFPYKQ